MARRRAKSSVCTEPGCPNIDCTTHARAPWAGSAHRGLPHGRPQQRRRLRVLRAYAGVCHVCGRCGADQVDHVIPLAFGGADDESNLRPIHATPCHRAKTAREAAAGRHPHPG
jgi:5-methylcytosine-specific restriction endonuclease McrA